MSSNEFDRTKRESEEYWNRIVEARARIAADNGLPIERVRLVDPETPPGDIQFLLALDRQLAEAVTFLPPAMRASFHAQVSALIRLASTVAEIDHEACMNASSQRAVEAWRSERTRITERTR